MATVLTMTTVVLFTRDLRVHDHPALHAASLTGEPIVPLFVLDPRLVARSANRARFLAECLVDLDRSLAERGSGLVIREGNPATEALSVAREAGARAIHLTADASVYANGRLRRLRDASAGLEVRTFPGHAVIEPGGVSTGSGGAYRVFTPYHRVWERAPRRPILPTADAIVSAGDPGGVPDPGEVIPDSPDLPRGGERQARRLLARFLDSGVASYDRARDRPAEDATSRLSPYLRFGCLSANEVVRRADAIEGGGSFVRQLAWRDFYFQRLAAEPRLGVIETSVLAAHGLDTEAFEAWRRGTTGLPMVDAGMRQLAREGWIHNRVRMLVANVLTRRLGIPWGWGAAHFARWLVDGDVANNTGGWQWAAASGIDPRPARVFNPVLQGERHDPDGGYVRRYVAELAGVQAPDVFTPWERAGLLEATGYPAPIIDPRASRASTSSTTPVAATRSSSR